MPDDEPSAALRALRDSVRAGIADTDEFVFQLNAALDALGLAPTSIAVPAGAERAAQRHLPGVHQALLTVLPTFLPALDERGRAALEGFFAPPSSADTASVANAVALASYLTLSSMLGPSSNLPVESRNFVLQTLAKISRAYGVDKIYWATRGSELVWEDAVRALAAVPSKAANAVGRWREAGWSGDVPDALVPRAYFNMLVTRLGGLMYELSQTQQDAAPLRVLLEKLVSLGLFTAGIRDTRTPAFMPPFLPPLLEHLHPPPGGLMAYPDGWLPKLLLPLSTSALAAYTASLLDYLPTWIVGLEPDRPEAQVKRGSIILGQVLGKAEVNGEAWNAVLRALLATNRSAWDDAAQNARRRIAVAWVGEGGQTASRALIDALLEAWADPKSIKFGLFSQQFNLTHALLLALSLLPPFDAHIVNLSRKARFIQAIQAHLSHPDAKIRRLGMLVAEVMSDRTIEEDDQPEAKEEDDMADLKAALEVDDETGEPKNTTPKAPKGPKKLRFTGMWEGSGDGKDECRWLRRCVGVRDAVAVLEDEPRAWMLGWDEHTILEPEHAQAPKPPPKAQPKRDRGRPSQPKPKPKIVMLDDEQAADPLEGYASPPSTSRSPSPTPSFLDEVAADPTLAIDATKKSKLKRPVYVRQLSELLRDRESPESIELALQWGESLVRAKRAFGTELADSAVAVAGAAVGLANPYNLDDFETRRQGLVTALVACAPRQVPPYLAEQYFAPSYSLLQKSVMLTALAMGARELAGLPVPDAPKTRAIDFASKTLPAHLHQKYITPSDVPGYAGQLEDAVEGIRHLLLSKGAARGEEVEPSLAREKQLRVGTPKRRKMGSASPISMGRGDLTGGQHADAAPAPVIPYTQVAGEYFILPLVNRFWDVFQAASVRETRSLELGGRYRGAGTGMVLSPMALEKFLLTLALLTHAARFAPTFLAVLAPAVLEVSVVVGARHPRVPEQEPMSVGSFSIGQRGAEDRGNAKAGDGDGRGEAQVVAAALELALATLDTSVDLDQGRTLARDAPQLVLAAGEWATGVFDAEERGVRLARAGAREGRVRAAAAGVVVKVAEIGEKWGPGVR